MSTVQEVQNALRGMSPQDRNRVKAFLLHLTRVDDPAHQAEMTRRLQGMEAGGGVSQDKVDQIHTELSRQGR
jgi:hypothetical protein